MARPPYAGAAALPGERSTAWRINREVVLLLGWGRAILLQFAHPLVAAGVAEHSQFATQTRGRRRRRRHTLEAMLALTFGTGEEIARAARGINRIHHRVHGTLPAPVGPFHAGYDYSAHDPALLRWVHATLLDTLPQVYELYVGPLSATEKNRYCAEASGLEPLLRVPPGYFPRSTAELACYLEQMYAGGQIAVGDTARRLAHELLTPPLPSLARPFLWFYRLPTIGLLPPAIRESYGFTWERRHELALRRSAALVRRLMPLTPPLLRHWPHSRRVSPTSGDSPSRGFGGLSGAAEGGPRKHFSPSPLGGWGGWRPHEQ
jgi:uncharacterized protein (DUF2236 family)